MEEVVESTKRGLQAANESDKRLAAIVDQSILLTDRNCTELGEGWTNYEAIGGRFPLATGQGTDTRDDTRQFELGEVSGEYFHRLTIDEMPEHTHPYKDRYISYHNRADHGDDRAVNWTDMDRTTDSSGRDHAHNNMPPYLALNFCHKP